MSREIKYRIWDKNLKLYGYQFIKYICAEDGTEYKVIAFNFSCGCRIVTLAEALESDNYIVEQYTGLKDKNGKKDLYAGDGGIHPQYGKYYIAFGEYITNSSEDQNIGFYIQWIDEFNAKTFRKDIGFWVEEGLLFDMNIHENPELLTERNL